MTDRERPPSAGPGSSRLQGTSEGSMDDAHHGALDGRRILKPETVAEMTRSRPARLTARPGMPWGLGFCVVEDPAKWEADSVLVAEFVRPWRSIQHASWADPAKTSSGWRCFSATEKAIRTIPTCALLFRRCREGTVASSPPPSVRWRGCPGTFVSESRVTSPSCPRLSCCAARRP